MKQHFKAGSCIAIALLVASFLSAKNQMKLQPHLNT